MVAEVGHLTVFDQHVRHYLSDETKPFRHAVVAGLLVVGIFGIGRVIVEFNTNNGSLADAVIQYETVVKLNQRSRSLSVGSDDHSLKTVFSALSTEQG